MAGQLDQLEAALRNADAAGDVAAARALAGEIVRLRSGAGAQAAATEIEGERAIAAEPRSSYARNLIGEMAQGATFGLADELAGAVRGPAIAEGIRAEQGRFRTKHPVASTVADLAGGTLAAGPVGFVGRGIAKVAPALGRVANLIPPRFRTMTGAGAAGAAYGAGSAAPGERLEGATRGGGTGLVAGAGASAVGAGARKVGEYGSARVNPDKYRDTKIREAFANDAVTAGTARHDLGRYGQTANLTDVGEENVRELAAAATGKRGVSRSQALEGLEKRPLPTPEPSPDYATAYAANPIMASPRLDQILDRPGSKAAIKAAVESLANQGVTAPPGSLAYLDEVKQQIDHRIKWDAAQNLDTRSLKQLRTDLVRELDRLDATGGLYAKARRQYEIDAQNAEEAEQAFGRTLRAVRGGAPEGLRDEVTDKIVGAAGATAASQLPGAHPFIVGGLGRRLAQMMMPMPAAEKISDALLTLDPAAQAAVLAKLQQTIRPPLRSPMPPSRAIALGVAQQVGMAQQPDEEEEIKRMLELARRTQP